MKNKLLRRVCQKLNRCANTLSVRRGLGIRDSLADIIYKENRSETSYRDLINIRRALNKTIGLGGDLAELGVYRGGTAKLIALSCPSVTLHLFDTFSGFPAKMHKLDTIGIGMYAVGLEAVQEYLSDFSNIVYHKGLFPQTTKDVAPECQYSFANLDADHYQVTFDALAYFYPRLVSHGMIMLHDYGYVLTPGVKQAVVDFGGFPLCTELFDHQLLIVKP